MKYLSGIAATASGSLGGITASRNRYGQYFRRRAVPVNPNTDLQVTVRAAMRAAVDYWTNTLADADRALWNVYAANTPMLGKLGQVQTLSGQTMMVRTFIAAVAAGLDGGSYAGAPTTFDLGAFTAPVTTATVASGLSVAFTAADDWAGEANSKLLLFEGRPQNASRAFFKGPWRFLGMVSGAVSPPTSPEIFATLPFAIEAGQIVWVRSRVLRADGRLSGAVDGGPYTVS
jgi:hypothetical protein